jgi:stage IV sporulation protein FB
LEYALFPSLSDEIKPPLTLQKVDIAPFRNASCRGTLEQMNGSHGLLTFSFPLGQGLGARWRLSFLMPVLALALLWRLQDVSLGLLAGAIVLLSIILHEIGHLIALSLSGGRPTEVLLWPLGSLTHHVPQSGLRTAVCVNLSGPAANLIMVATCLALLPDRATAIALLNPFATFKVPDNELVLLTAVRMCFFANWCLALCNFIPVMPLDLGRVVHSFLCLRFTRIECRDLMLRSGLVLSAFALLAGFVFNISALTALSAFLLILHLHESVQQQPTADVDREEEDETFLGYDFSEGYSSLARSAARQDDAEDSFLSHPDNAPTDNWDTRHRAAIQQAADQLAEEDRILDAILKKLHERGRDALNTRELGVLKLASDRFRQRHAEEL